MKRHLLIFMLITGLWSCERDSLESDESISGNYPKHIIGISAQTEDIQEDIVSRGTPINSVQQMTNIGVFCSYTGLTDWSAVSTPAKMFNTELVRNSGAGKWAYTGPPVSWGAATGNDRYSFFAYAPKATTQNGIVVQGNATTAGIPEVTYSVPSDVALQPDLMLAVPRYNLRPVTGMVALDMKHALACVGFQIQGNGEKIKSLTLSGIFPSGLVKVDGGSITWSLAGPTSSFSPLINYDSGKDYYTVTTTMSTNLLPGNGYLMMIPQTLSSSAKLTLTFADNTTKDISLTGQSWVAGKKITYNIIITPTGIITLTPSTYYIPSIGVTHLTDNFQLSCTPANMQWTLSSNTTWLRLTTSSLGANPSQTISGQGAMPIYTVADANPGGASRVASLYVNGNQSTIAGTITQLKKVDLVAIKNGGRTPIYVTTYVGAFWRASQTGERIIRIPLRSYNDGVGEWTASIEWMDGNWKPDDIRFSPVTSLDPNVSYSSDVNPNDAELYKVNEKLTATSGIVAATGAIYFRIGLNSVFTPTAATPARYAVVALTYNNGMYTQLILLRQGETEDYVMRPIDPAKGSFINAVRPMARKVAAFNITQPRGANWLGGDVITNHPTLSLKGGAFTEYPSQVGALFQWASLYQQRRGFHPINPLTAITNWDINAPSQFWTSAPGATPPYKFSEVCPDGYKRINDGPEDIATSMTASTSELRQSLLDILVDGTPTTSPENAIYGYYADGFFDRRQIKASYSGTDPTVVSYYPATPSDQRNAQIAYCGTLIYNPITWASVFYPLTGYRNSSDGAMSSSEQYSCYWTASAKSISNYATAFYPTKVGRFQFGIEFRRPVGGAIRCVKVP